MTPEQLQTANKDYPATISEIAAKNGFEISKEELLEQIRVATSSEELSDEQLEAVAGGKGSAEKAGKDGGAWLDGAAKDTGNFFKKAGKGW